MVEKHQSENSYREDIHFAAPEVDREVDELRILLDEVFDGVLFQEVKCLLLQIQAAGQTARNIRKHELFTEKLDKEVT